MSDIVLEIKNLTRRFGVPHGGAVTLSVNAGEVFGLLGASGRQGSTMLARSGRQVRRASPPSPSPGGRRSSCHRLCAQAVSVDGSLTGYDLLIFAKLYDLPHREQPARIAEALEFMNLTADSRSAWWAEVSGGMVRRLEIAQATLHRPSYLRSTVGLRATRSGNISWICGQLWHDAFLPRIIWRRKAIVAASPSCTWQRGALAPAKN